ncbi:MAG: tetratricopeptide repeat protein [Gammaproteobacteria bacterium]
MSLLMDALRKAEADKKAAAARAAGETPRTDGFARSPGELRLEPLGDETDEAPGLARSGEYGAFGSTTQRLSASGRFRLADDDTLAEPLTIHEGTSSTPLAEPGTLGRPARVTARTVFAATARRRANPLALGIGVVLVLCIAGAGIVGYRALTALPRPPAIPSPRVALGVEREPPGPAIAPTPPRPDVPPEVPDVAAAAPVIPVAPEVAIPADAPAPAGPAAPADEHAPAAVMADASPAVPAPPSAAPAPPAPTSATASPPAATADVLASPAPPADGSMAPGAHPPASAESAAQAFEMRNGDLHIARSPGVATPLRDALTQAYAAYVGGDLAAARRGYVGVLKRHPEQRDALLGLGAVALRENRLAEAHSYYRAVLADAPDHPVATAALFLIEGGRGPDATETRLKLLLDRGLDAPYLHFALGNLYAREARWGDAQRAYFEAFRGAPRNADYAFNLAVSLDRLGQRKAALDYYRQAEALRGPNTAFDGATVAARITALAIP